MDELITAVERGGYSAQVVAEPEEALDHADEDALRRQREIDRLRRAVTGSALLTIPGEYRAVPEVPKLGSGKTDFTRAKALALQML